MRRGWAGACTLLEGCVLQVGHAGACKLGDVAEEEYEVERIVDQRAKRGGRRGGKREYLIKWLGFASPGCSCRMATASDVCGVGLGCG